MTKKLTELEKTYQAGFNAGYDDGFGKGLEQGEIDCKKAALKKNKGLTVSEITNKVNEIRTCSLCYYEELPGNKCDMCEEEEKYEISPLALQCLDIFADAIGYEDNEN